MATDRIREVTAICAALAAEKDREALLFRILDTAMDFTRCDGGTLYLLEDDKLHFCRMITRSMGVRQGGDADPITLPPVPLKPAHVSAMAVLEGRLINVSDVRSDDRFDFSGAAAYDAMTGYTTRSMLVFPLTNDRGKIIGVLQLINALDEAGNPTAFSAEMEPLVRAIAAQAATSLTELRADKAQKKTRQLTVASVLLLLGLLFVFFNLDVFGTDVLSAHVELSDPLNYYQNGERSYVIDSTGLEIMVLENGKYLFALEGGLTEDGFYYARDIKTDEQGNLYILDKQLNDNGKSIDAERILRFEPDGSFAEVVYTLPHEDGSSVLQLYNLEVTEEAIRFISTSPNNAFTVHKLFRDGVTADVSQLYPYEDIYEMAWDFAFDGEGNIYVSAKNGVIEKIAANSGKRTVLYADTNGESAYYSIPTSIEYASDGTIYFNDIGERQIRKLYPDGSVKTAVDIAEPIEEPPMAFSEQPIYSGLFVSEDLSVTTFYSHSYFLETEDGEGEQIYEYKMFTESAGGEHLFNGNVFEKSGMLYARGLITAVFSLIIAVALLGLLGFAARKMSKANISGVIKIQLIIIFTAVIAACISIYIIVSETNKVYYNEIMNNLENVALLLSHDIEEEDLEQINTPADFLNEGYRNISESVLEVLNYSINNERGIYCVIYKAQNDIVSAVYADDAMYGSGYPMPGSLEGSAEQEIYATGEAITFASHSSSEGNFMFVLTPIFGEDHQVIGLMEIGTDLYSVTENTRKQVVNTILLVMTAVMVGVLLVSELIVIRANLKKSPLTKDKSLPLDSSLVRPVVFLFFFISNMPTAFLPVFARSLWTDAFPMPVEVATALPVSAELLVTAIVSLVCGFAVSRIGARLMCIVGVGLQAIGNFLCFLAPNLTALVLASGITGTGAGLIILAINSYIAGYEDDNQINDGFMHYNAALLSGINCGTVIGSAIAEHFDYSSTYFTATCICLLLAVFAFFCIRDHKHEAPAGGKEGETAKPNVLRFLFKPSVLRYFLLISSPYLICASFMNYFFPIFGEESGLTPTQISLAFLLTGIISIYFGPTLTKLFSEKFGARKSMLIATGLYAAALLIFIVRPEISSCYVAVAIFAFADSFGFTAQSVYYSTMPETLAIGEGPAMGINSGFENAASTVGPLIFGTALMAGNVAGITMIFAGFVTLALLFVFTSRIGKGAARQK
ncbi:MAG: MFS transporter [Clostridia bacterium]|nr:MFS transporter [Clostridia bacterium]